MALADPFVLTLNDGSSSLARTSTGVNQSRYRLSNDDGDYQLNVSHAYGRRTSRLIQLRRDFIAESLTNNTVSVPTFVTAHLVVSEPSFLTAADRAILVADAVGLMGSLTASTNAKLIALLGGQN